MTVAPATHAAARVEPRWGVGDAVIGFGVAIIGTVMTTSIWVSVGGASEGLGALAAAQVGMWLGFVGAPVVAVRRRGSGSLSADFGVRSTWRDVGLGIPLGVACQLVLVPVVFLAMRPFVDVGDASEPATRVSDLAEGATGFGLLVLSVVLLAPLAEELFFRGLLLRSLTRAWGPTAGVVVSAAIFGATHFQPLQFLPLAAFGAVLAVAAHRTGRLGLAVWTHVGFNATTVVLLSL